jgi:hypothetical protein
MTKPKRGDKRAQVLALVQRPGGASNAEVQAALLCPADGAYTQLRALALLGMAHKVARQFGADRCRYFGTTAEAQAWEQAGIALASAKTAGAHATHPPGWFMEPVLAWWPDYHASARIGARHSSAPKDLQT